MFAGWFAAYAAMGPAPWRAQVVGTYDDGDWTALLLEDVGGGHPDLSCPSVAERVLEAVLLQSAELTPPPVGTPTDSLLRITLLAQRRVHALVPEAGASARVALWGVALGRLRFGGCDRPGAVDGSPGRPGVGCPQTHDISRGRPQRVATAVRGRFGLLASSP